MTGTAPASSPRSCPNCDSTVPGRYCPTCGQDNRLERLDARTVVRDAVHNFFGWDTALGQTLAGLVRAPGRMVDEYVSGRRRRFVNPARFCLLSLALWFLTTRAFQVDPMDVSGLKITGSSSEEAGRIADQVRVFIGKHLDLLMFLSLPLRAVLLRFFFRRSGRNLAEAMVLVLYVAGLGYLLGTILTPLFVLGQSWVVPARPVLTLLWSCWAAREFFGTGWFPAIWRVLVVSMLHALGTVVLFGGIAVPWVLLRGA